MFTLKYIKSRVAEAWAPIDHFKTIWKSTDPDKLKRQFFRAVVELCLYMGLWWGHSPRETDAHWMAPTPEWHVPRSTWLGRSTQGINGYWNIPIFLLTTQERRLRFDGHCWRSKEKLASNMFQWIPSHCTTVTGGWRIYNRLHKMSDAKLKTYKR